MRSANDNKPPLEPREIWIDGIGYVTQPPEWMEPQVWLHVGYQGPRARNQHIFDFNGGRDRD
jgi:hypothetical protein